MRYGLRAYLPVRFFGWLGGQVSQDEGSARITALKAVACQTGRASAVCSSLTLLPCGAAWALDVRIWRPGPAHIGRSAVTARQAVLLAVVATANGQPAGHGHGRGLLRAVP